jgi:hypothetical protein
VPAAVIKSVSPSRLQLLCQAQACDLRIHVHCTRKRNAHAGAGARQLCIPHNRLRGQPCDQPCSLLLVLVLDEVNPLQ